MNSSKTKTVALVVLALSGAIAFLDLAGTDTPSSTAGIDRAKPGPPASAAHVRGAYGQLPLAFELNRGQADAATNFRARGAGYTLSLSATEAAFLLARGPDEPSPTVLRMNLVGANPDAAVEGLNELEGTVNYLIGNDPAQWRTNIPTFSRVRYNEVYRGVDVVYYGNQRRLEYDFVVAPGSNVEAITLEFAGAQRMEVEALTGDLLLGIGEKSIRQHKPVVYQETSAGRREIEGRYALRSGGRVGFEVGEYDAGTALVIDPVLEYSTFLGGNGRDESESIAVDSAGNAYVAGFTESTDFPIANAVQSTNRGIHDVFVTKLNAAGSALVYSTYLGGSNGDLGLEIAVDSTGSAYVTGVTFSTDFPMANALQGMNASGGNTLLGDAFVAKLSPAGSALVYSTYLGGSDAEQGDGIAVDSAGNAYVTGHTRSTNFPTANALQNTNGGGSSAFVTKLNPAGSALVYSTYLGGDGGDGGTSITVDSAGNAYVTGSTVSSNFPTVNPIQSTLGGADDFSDAFVTKFNAAGSALVYSTYLGGSGSDSAQSIAVDSTGNACVTGGTNSTNFPTANALQNAIGGTFDAFVTKLNVTGSALVYSTYLGGNDTESGSGIDVDSAGNAYVTGFTLSANFPIANALQSTLGGGPFSTDAFVTKLNGAGSTLIYSTYLGGDNGDVGHDIAVDSAGNAYVTGITGSKCFPTTTGAFDTTLVLGGDLDAFITKISETAQPSTLAPCPSQLLNIATRLRVLTGDGALIGGFIITGNEPKYVIIRGIGPSLTGLPGVLANPVLQLFDSNQVLLDSNDDWKSNQGEVEFTMVPPTHDLESAIVIVLAPGAYTAVLRGQNNGIGIGVVELYDLHPGSNSILANIGSRGFVDTGDNAMIGGFILGAGSSETRVLIRAIGPSLSPFISGALANPTLELRDADGSLIRENDNWRDSQETEIQATGIPPTNNLESAILASLGNGNYTAILRGKDNTTGVAVVEVYNMD